ncbi:MAG: sigma-70 family RNA polymerase sigma factor [Bryobacteraceae bacterium]|nr:sigma-70 family RNA polymerase sigma factor [Bryobacteraceae bacterium]
MNDSDSVAIERAVAGDGDGFKVLVERYSRLVFRLAYRMTGNESEAEDVVQETFLRAYRSLSSYDGRSSFSTWLYRIATNYSLDLIAKRNRRAELQPPLDDEHADRQWETPSSAPGPDRLAASSQIHRRIRNAMSLLSAQERSAFVLRHFEELSVEEISDSLGIGPSAARHCIFRAVQKLRRSLAPYVSSEL